MSTVFTNGPRDVVMSEAESQTFLGTVAIANPKPGLYFDPIPGFSEMAPTVITSSNTLQCLNPGSLPPQIAIHRSDWDAAMDLGRGNTAQRAQLNIAPGATQRVYFAPTNAIFDGTSNVSVGASLYALGIALWINNTQGTGAPLAEIAIISQVGSSSGGGGALTDRADGIMLQPTLGSGGNVFVHPVTQQRNSPMLAAMNGSGAQDRVIVPGAAGPMTLLDPLTGEVFDPAFVVGRNNNLLGRIAHPGGADVATFADVGRPFYAVTITNRGTAQLTGDLYALNGFIGGRYMSALDYTRKFIFPQGA